ncbi:hypothetical protein LTR96_010355 [Exophiala xenobiotica]|nr:hypothetical protein LTR96_010355 [Exophiala xenobiotica]KAK5333244.1 hypothetical protein LTR98_010638 [Exophiala xenobiotica]KAK5554086.1 hypothetical protein LTR46_007733 [Exophiala xenobiotica]
MLNTNDINEVHHADNTLGASDVAGAHQTNKSLNANLSAAIRPLTKDDRNFSEPFPSTRTQAENKMMFSTVFPEPSSNSMPTNNTVLEHDSLPAFAPNPTLMDTGLFSFDAWPELVANVSLLGWMNEEAQGYGSFDMPDIHMGNFRIPGFDDQFRLPSSQDSTNACYTAAPPLQTRQTATESHGASNPLPAPQRAHVSSPSMRSESSETSPLQEIADSVPVEKGSESNPWPFEWHATTDDQKIALPELRSTESRWWRNDMGAASSRTLQGASQLFGASDVLDERKRSSIVELLSLPLSRIPWQEDVSMLRTLPRPDVLDHLVDLYFLHFHELWPIIHQPTFEVSKAPTIQVLSMACIGACYSGLENSLDFADTLAELCRRTSTWMAEHDPRFLRSPSYGISLLLQHIHAIGSGSRRLFEMTDSSRSRLVNIGRHMNHFCTNLHASRSNLSSRTVDTYERWLEWVRKEQVCRLIWFIFEFDCFYTAFSKQPPCIKFEDLPPDFPSEQVHWEAPTAFAWASCPYQTAPRGLPTTQTLHGLLSKAPDVAPSLKSLDHLGKRLLTRCLGRCLESIQEQMESSVYHVLWEESTGRAVTCATRSRISRSIMSVYESSWEDNSRGSNLRVSLRIAIAAHYSHMFAAGKLTGLITQIARKRAGEHDSLRPGNLLNPSSGVGNSGKATPHDDAFIKAAFNEDPKALREMMWHASQVFYLQRRHPFNSPHEPLSVFLAGISLWAFLKYFNPETNDDQDRVPVQLDEPSFCSRPEAREAIRNWIERGGRTYLEGVGDVRSPDAPRRILSLCIDMTKRLKVWRMASKVSEIFIRLLQREDQEYSDTFGRV